MISILLSSYNGELHIGEQIDSIIDQTNKDWKLYIRDDGSTDNTIKIIHGYLAKFPQKIYLIDGIEQNLGAKKSFIYLLKIVKSQYYMFCDQDDIWLPTKIEKSLTKMRAVESAHPSLPILIHTDLIVVDSKKQILHNSFWKYSKLNPSILQTKKYLGVCNGLTGCSMIFNNLAKEIALPFLHKANLHDWGLALIVSDKGIIGYLDESLILYRQHESNVVGAKAINTSYFIRRLVSVMSLINANLQTYQEVSKFGYGSFFKYLFYKAKYLYLRNKQFK